MKKYYGLLILTLYLVSLSLPFIAIIDPNNYQVRDISGFEFMKSYWVSFLTVIVLLVIFHSFKYRRFLGVVSLLLIGVIFLHLNLSPFCYSETNSNDLISYVKNVLLNINIGYYLSVIIIVLGYALAIRDFHEERWGQ